MKKGVLVVVILIVAAVAGYFILGKKEEAPQAPKQQPLAISKNSEAFNKPFNEMLNNYYDLKDALVEWDTAKVVKAAGILAASTARIPFAELKGDTTIVATAKSFAENIAAESNAIIAANGIEEKRRSFYTLSEGLYNLLRTVHYDQTVIYHMNCPMAFNDSEEAFWISNSNQVVNPYLGKKHPKYKAGMVECGSVQDSIDFRQH